MAAAAATDEDVAHSDGDGSLSAADPSYSRQIANRDATPCYLLGRPDGEGPLVVGVLRVKFVRHCLLEVVEVA